MNKVIKFLLWSLVLMGILIRIYDFGTNPTGLYWDEQAILADAKSIATTGQDLHGQNWLQPIFLSYGDYKLPVYIWFVSVAGKLVGWSALAVRLPNFVAGLISIWLIGDLAVLLLAKFNKLKSVKLESVDLKLVTMAVVASAPWAIHFSRVGFEAFFGQFLLVLSWWVWFKRDHFSNKVVAVLIAILATYAYFSVRFVWLGTIGIVWLIEVLMNWRPKTKRVVQKSIMFGLLVAVYGLGLWPMLTSNYYQASNQFRLSTPSILNSTDYAVVSNQLREFAGNTFIDRGLYHRHLLLVRAGLMNLSAQLDPNFLFLSGESNLRHSTNQHGLFLIILLPALLFGLVVCYQKSRQLWLLLIGWWLLANLPALVPLEVPHALRSLNALTPLAIIIGIGTAKIFENWRRQRHLIIVFLLIWLVLLTEYGYYLHTVYPKLSAQDWQTGFTPIAASIYRHSLTTDATVWVDPFDDRFYLWFWTQVPEVEVQKSLVQKSSSHQIFNMVFNGIIWDQVKTNDFVFGPKDYVESELKNHSLQIETIETYLLNDRQFLLGKVINE